jgi:predicted small lipoprotein YifL
MGRSERCAVVNASSLGLVAPVALVALVALAACGGPAKPPPAATESLTNDAGVEAFREVNPADLAELDAGAAPATAAATAAPPPPPDDCTPVGVDFEKRARPKLKDCYASGKKKDPNLQGSVKIAVEIDPSGKVKGFKIVEKTLPDPVAQCMLKVVKGTPLPEASKCPAKTLTIPVTFPTPR